VDHLLADDLVRLGWERGVADAAEDALRDLSSSRRELDLADGALADDINVAQLSSEETSTQPRFAAEQTTSTTPLLRR
jgi:hypothetical protein